MSCTKIIFCSIMITYNCNCLPVVIFVRISLFCIISFILTSQKYVKILLKRYYFLMERRTFSLIFHWHGCFCFWKWLNFFDYKSEKYRQIHNACADNNVNLKNNMECKNWFNHFCRYINYCNGNFYSGGTAYFRLEWIVWKPFFLFSWVCFT